MKKLITLLLIACSASVFGQTPFTIRGEIKQVYKTGSVNDTVRQFLSGDSANYKTSKSLFNYNKKLKAPLFLMNTDTVASKAYVRSLIGVEYDPVWTLAQPYYVTRVELGDTAEAIRASGGGSTITASDGVYMDGDTVKLGGNATYNDFTVYKLVDDKYFDITDVNENFGLSFSTFSGNYGTTLKGGLVGWPRSSISANSSGVNLGYSKTSGGNTLTLQVNEGGAVFSEMPDTTLTTPTHLMTEAQTKREIAAASNLWTPVAGGIGYNGAIWPGQIRKVFIDNLNFMQLDSVSANSTVIKSTTNRGIALSISSNYGTNIRNTTNYGNVIYNNDNRGYVIYNNLNSGTTIYESSLGIGAATIRGNYQGSLARISNSREDTIIVVNNTGNATYRKNAALYALKNLGVLSNVLRGDGKQVIAQIQASLTDGAPTASQITTAVGESPSDVRAGYQATIKDTDGSGLLYKIESDGTDWFYTVMTKAL